ncbi:MAG TPA: isocitrate/isopropylmalate family dehydrogenase [Planctomycetota bacterium]|nr:isocitrate/isopropylmalate family dehydrogenase [Planctomycetota bacterium]
MHPTSHTVVELLGDGISPELSASVHRVVDALALPIAFEPIDLSRRSRESRGSEPLYAEAVAQIRRRRAAIKYPTETYRESPNAVLRDRLGLSVIHRPVATIPGIPTLFTRPLDLHIVRVATGGTYEDHGRRVGSDAAVSIRVIEKKPCAEAAEFAFRLASGLRAGVVSSSKWTIQEAADGLFHEAVDEVARRHAGVPHRRELFDALLARLVMRPDDYRVVVTPNEYGDFLSDLACGLIGSMGLGDSANYSFRENGEIDCAIFDPAGGTAPDIAGKDLANPSAALFAFATYLRHLGDERSGTALRRAVLDAIAAGERTRDLGGRLGTSAFTDAVVRRAADLLAFHPVGG